MKILTAINSNIYSIKESKLNKKKKDSKKEDYLILPSKINKS
jgi:hypothetical protein